VDRFSNTDGSQQALRGPGDTYNAICSQGAEPSATGQNVAQARILDVQETEQHETSRKSVSHVNWATRLDVDQWLLGHLLQRHRAMQHHFPFVVVPEAWTVQYMLTCRPTLLLAIIASSACHYPRLQQVLVQDLKDILTRRVMTNGENDLELLQALLVHLAW
jgi:hypothetical protein